VAGLGGFRRLPGQGRAIPPRAARVVPQAWP
jgi:hypothetical protein